MNLKTLNIKHDIKLAHNLTSDQYEIVFGSLNVTFDNFNDAADAFVKMVKANKPTLQQRVVSFIKGKAA